MSSSCELGVSPGPIRSDVPLAKGRFLGNDWIAIGPCGFGFFGSAGEGKKNMKPAEITAMFPRSTSKVGATGKIDWHLSGLSVILTILTRSANNGSRKSFTNSTHSPHVLFRSLRPVLAVPLLVEAPEVEVAGRVRQLFLSELKLESSRPKKGKVLI